MSNKILITGADGFIGSHLVEKLVESGYNVKAFVYYNSFNSNGWLDAINKDIFNNIEIFQGDVRDPHGVEIALNGCSAVIHLAALIGIPYSYHSPDSYVDTNIRGTLNILQGSKKLNINKILITSTSEVYGTAQSVPITENHPLQAQSPYSATKIASEKIAESFFRSFDLPVTIVRPFNTYGPRQSARAIIPSLIIQLLDGKNEIKIGNTTPTRDFVFVNDTVDGFIKIFESDNTKGEIINISTSTEISIEYLAYKLINKINPNSQLIHEKIRLRPNNSEVERLLGSNDKLFNLTGWKPTIMIDNGLDLTISWIRNNLHQFKTNNYNI